MYPKLIIFDLDGVLVETKNFHFNALNKALSSFGEHFIISSNEHLTLYDGLSTKQKLDILVKEKNLPKESLDETWELKQKFTLDELKKNLKPDLELVLLLQSLKEKNFKLAIASNSIRLTVEFVIEKLGLNNVIDFFVANENVSLKKPHPEIFWKCMTIAKTVPDSTVIIEDSPVGRNAAARSGAHLLPVESRSDINKKLIDRIFRIFGNEEIRRPWKSNNLNILIPMAGGGSRFSTQGYSFPKPLIEVRGKPMIQVVVENLNLDAHYIFVVQKEHYDKYNLNYLLPLISKSCDIIQVDSITEGAACTTLLAKEYINNNKSLLIANSDQFIEWNSNEVMYAFSNNNIDAGILCFESTHPKWSYAKLDQDGFVCEVAEKRPISKLATSGIYYWKKGSDYVKYAESMIQKNIRFNNEFYVCPVFNEAIKDNKKLKVHTIGKENMWGLGTPEDLNYFLENYNRNV